MRVDWGLIHPSVRERFKLLAEDLQEGYRLHMTNSDFRPFEGFRSPERQAQLFAEGHTKARPWQSAHQFGLAVDFVVWSRGAWSWDRNHDWNYLRRCATARGLVNNIEWDRPHVEAPQFQAIRLALIPEITGSAA